MPIGTVFANPVTIDILLAAAIQLLVYYSLWGSNKMMRVLMIDSVQNIGDCYQYINRSPWGNYLSLHSSMLVGVLRLLCVL